MAMKILFDATVLVDGNDMVEERRGIYFIAKNLLQEMAQRDEIDVVLFASGYKVAGLSNVNRLLNLKLPVFRKIPALANFFHTIVTFCRKKRMANFQKPMVRKVYASGILFFSSISQIYFFVKDLFYRTSESNAFFSPRTAAPWFIRRDKKIRTYVVLHDLIPYVLPEYAGQRSVGWFGYLIRHLNKNDYYFAISESTKQDFCKFSSKIDPSHVMTVSWAADERYKPKKQIGIVSDKRYVFSLCSLEPRKNLLRIVRTFIWFVEKNQIKDLRLVVGGGEWLDVKKILSSELKLKEPLEKYMTHVGYVKDPDLPELYGNAEWFVYTSQYEGFGLPPLEAMQCGCPVITSNTSSLPEVVGDAGIMIDWDSDEQHIKAYEQYYFNEELRKENSRKGLERAKQFSWGKTVDSMVSFICGVDKENSTQYGR